MVRNYMAIIYLAENKENISPLTKVRALASIPVGLSLIHISMGFRAIQGYGMTETAPIIAFNVPGRERSDSVGEVIPNVEVKIADDGEILVKGKNVMKGYYNNEQATKEAFDKDGWFHTGDLGRMEGKYLIIIGRKKEMIVLPNGKNIDPNDVEGTLKLENPANKPVGKGRTQKSSEGLVQEL